MSEALDHLPQELLVLAHKLLAVSQTGTVDAIRHLLDQGAPAWYQDEDLGWSCLHYAAERRQPEVLKVLLRGGAVWNAVDEWGRTAGEICLSLGDQEGWEVIRNEGIRTEMLHHALAGPSSPASNSSTNIRLRAEDNTSAGDNLTFIQSKLTWDQGSDGRERVLDADGNGVMMGWEEPLMIEHLRLLTQGRDENLSVLNVGYGLGIIDRLLQATKPRRHIIMEAHPDVLQHMRKQGVYDWPNVHILEGRWQDWLQGEKISEVIELSDGGFDSIFVDTFAEGYEDLKAFFEVLPDILEAENGRFSFWNGLGATNATIYAVSCGLAELHLEDVGLSVEWTDVPIPESQRSEVWKGVKRRYWDLPGYRLPVGKMQLI